MKLIDGYEIIGKYGSEMVAFPEVFSSRTAAYKAIDEAERWFENCIGTGFTLAVKVLEKAILDESQP